MSSSRNEFSSETDYQSFSVFDKSEKPADIGLIVGIVCGAVGAFVFYVVCKLTKVEEYEETCKGYNDYWKERNLEKKSKTGRKESNNE